MRNGFPGDAVWLKGAVAVEDLFAELARGGAEVLFRKGQILFVEGMPASTLFIVLSGRVKVVRTAPDGREQILHLLGRGEAIAVVPFFDRGPYPATAEVVEDARLRCIHWERFDAMVRENAQLLWQVNRHLASRLRNAREQIARLGLHDATARVAALLLDLAAEHGRPVEGGVTIELDLTRRELGSFIGLSRETVTRVLSDFKRSGVVEVAGNTIVIRDRERLALWRNLS